MNAIHLSADEFPNRHFAYVGRRASVQRQSCGDRVFNPLGSAAMPRDLEIRGYTVGQFPNRPLWVALAALLISRLSAEGGTVNDTARAVLYMALTVWAYEEAARGVNGFRRGLGAVALVLIVVAVARAFG
jgi:hypothetical protein